MTHNTSINTPRPSILTLWTLSMERGKNLLTENDLENSQDEKVLIERIRVQLQKLDLMMQQNYQTCKIGTINRATASFQYIQVNPNLDSSFKNKLIVKMVSLILIAKEPLKQDNITHEDLIQDLADMLPSIQAAILAKSIPQQDDLTPPIKTIIFKKIELLDAVLILVGHKKPEKIDPLMLQKYEINARKMSSLERLEIRTKMQNCYYSLLQTFTLGDTLVKIQTEIKALRESCFINSDTLLKMENELATYIDSLRENEVLTKQFSFQFELIKSTLERYKNALGLFSHIVEMMKNTQKLIEIIPHETATLFEINTSLTGYLSALQKNGSLDNEALENLQFISAQLQSFESSLNES